MKPVLGTLSCSHDRTIWNHPHSDYILSVCSFCVLCAYSCVRARAFELTHIHGMLCTCVFVCSFVLVCACVRSRTAVCASDSDCTSASVRTERSIHIFVCMRVRAVWYACTLASHTHTHTYARHTMTSIAASVLSASNNEREPASERDACWASERHSQ